MTVVVGIDSTSTAKRAAKTAARLANGLGTDLVVACAVSDKSSGPSVPDIDTSTRDRALKFVQKSADELGEDFADLEISVEAEEGKPADVLVSIARAKKADIIVIGNKGVQGVQRILGSVAQDVVRKATCDVYVAYTR